MVGHVWTTDPHFPALLHCSIANYFGLPPLHGCCSSRLRQRHGERGLPNRIGIFRGSRLGCDDIGQQRHYNSIWRRSVIAASLSAGGRSDLEDELNSPPVVLGTAGLTLARAGSIASRRHAPYYRISQRPRIVQISTATDSPSSRIRLHCGTQALEFVRVLKGGAFRCPATLTTRQ